METKEYKNGQYRFDEGSKMKQILDDIWDERVREEILKEIKPLDNNLLEKIGSFAYFEEFISGDLLEKAWKMPWGWSKKEDLIFCLICGKDDKRFTFPTKVGFCPNLANNGDKDYYFIPASMIDYNVEPLRKALEEVKK